MVGRQIFRQDNDAQLYWGKKVNGKKGPDTLTTCLAFIGWNVIEEQILEQLTTGLVRV
jgi:hypothetical protein